MQRAEGPSSRLAPEPIPTRPSLSPPVAFLILVVVIGILGAIFYLTRPNAPATPTNPNAAQEPDFSLTNEEAITRFEELEALRQQIYLSRDASLIPAALTSDSPLSKAAFADIKRLIRDKVIDKTIFTTRSLEVITNEPTEVVIRQSFVQDPSFVAVESGQEVGSSSDRFVVLVDWTMRLEGTSWKFYDSDVIRSRRVR